MSESLFIWKSKQAGIFWVYSKLPLGTDIGLKPSCFLSKIFQMTEIPDGFQIPSRLHGSVPNALFSVDLFKSPLLPKRGTMSMTILLTDTSQTYL